MNLVAQIRRDICGDCRDGCDEQRAGRIDHADPRTACPRRIWHAWGDCAAAARPEVVPTVSLPAHLAPSRWQALLRTLRGWRRAGIRWVGRERRSAILPICRGCEWHRVHARTGLVSCGRGCNCGRASVAVIREGAECQAGNWPP